MKTINVKVNNKHRSIQNGFEWKNIPMFAIITGVNGAGKTHLLEVLNSDTGREITNKGGRKHKLILSDIYKNPKIKYTYDGLVKYYNQRSQHLSDLLKQRQALDDFKNQNTQTTVQSSTIVRHPGGINRTAHRVPTIQEREAQLQQVESSFEQLISSVYELELRHIAESAAKDIDDVLIEDIELYANRDFNHITEISDFGKYIVDEENSIKRKVLAYSECGEISKMEAVRDCERAYQKINALFAKYEFDYFEMLDPFEEQSNKNMLFNSPSYNSQIQGQTAQLIFKGKKGEKVMYDHLSTGEKMIVQFIMWSMARDHRGNRINTMLLDEPDARLHPSMCKMMIDILSELAAPKSEGGSGIRIIMTTHSPSTVAFAPEESLFVMEKDDDSNRSIRSTLSSEAMSVLSDGIFTLEKAASVINLAVTSGNKNIIFMEGKTDPIHLEKAIKMLGYEDDLDAQIIGMYGVSTLYSFVNSLPSALVPNKKVIALFDGDSDGIGMWGKFKSPKTPNLVFDPVFRVVTEQALGNFYASYLIASQEGTKTNCPIEYLYPLEFLKGYNILQQIEYSEFEKLEKASSPEQRVTLNEEYEHGKTYRVFKLKKDEKVNFSEDINDVANPDVFEGFRPTLDLIKKIVEL